MVPLGIDFIYCLARSILMTTQNPILVDTPDDLLHNEWNERGWIRTLTLDGTQLQIFNELRVKFKIF